MSMKIFKEEKLKFEFKEGIPDQEDSNWITL